LRGTQTLAALCDHSLDELIAGRDVVDQSDDQSVADDAVLRR
jgi:hypothetical protein